MSIRRLLWAAAIVCLSGTIVCQTGTAQICADSSAVVILAANHTARTFELYVKAADSSYSVIGRSLPASNLIFVLPSPPLKGSPTIIILWLLMGTHEMVADTITRNPGIVNVYRREFGEPSPQPQRS